MRRVASLVLAGFTHTVLAAEPGQFERSAVIVGIDQPGPNVPALVQGESDSSALGQTLNSTVGYEHVSIVLGAQASGADLIAALKSAVDRTSDSGTLLVVITSHGAGGDIGEPAFLTHGAQLSDPSRTGLSIDAFASALRPRTTDQNIVVVMDTAHDTSVGGVALIGPSASDWPDLPDWGLTVTSKSAGSGGKEGLLIPTLTAGLEGAGDRNFDGQVTISELSYYLEKHLDGAGTGQLERNGAVAANLVVGWAGRVAPEPTAPVTVLDPSALDKSNKAKGGFQLRPLPVAVASAGAVAGLLSVGMYISKMGECEDSGGKTICGDDEAYRQFRTTQHILGWAGAGLIVTGVGLQLIPTPDGAMMGVVGSF